MLAAPGNQHLPKETRVIPISDCGESTSSIGSSSDLSGVSREVKQLSRSGRIYGRPRSRAASLVPCFYATRLTTNGDNRPAAVARIRLGFTCRIADHALCRGVPGLVL